MRSFAFVVAAAAALFGSSDAQSAVNTTALKSLGQIKYPNAAFTFVNGGDLHICSFNPFGKPSVAEVKDIGKAVKDSVANIKPVVLTEEITWPNEVVTVPAGTVKGFDNLLAIAGGFLVPGNGNGAVTLMDRKTGKMNKLTSTGDRWYHQVEWRDVDGDGLLDIITAGANKPLFGGGYGSLYYLKQPASNPMGQPWEQVKLIDGPDVFFRLVDTDGDGKEELIASEFWANQLTIYRDLNWLNPASGFKKTVVDNKIGPLFSVDFEDLNGDGKREILVTNHVGDKNGGGVFVYEYPSLKKHVIASGIVNILSGPGQAAPGAARIIKPNSKAAYPSIVVAGDGAGKAYLLTPKDNQFNYDLAVFYDAGKTTIGALAVGDIDKDGVAEVFVPEFEKGFVNVFRFN